jgi:hypothetical protein
MFAAADLLAEDVLVARRVSGTHTGTLAVPHGPSLSATGRRLQNPQERVAITVRNGKVTQWAVEAVPGGGLAGSWAEGRVAAGSRTPDRRARHSTLVV